MPHHPYGAISRYQSIRPSEGLPTSHGGVLEENGTRLHVALEEVLLLVLYQGANGAMAYTFWLFSAYMSADSSAKVSSPVDEHTSSRP
jgi:hypothetical protein